MPKPARTVSLGFGLHASPMRGANPHWCFCRSESLAHAVANVALFPAISSPQFVIVLLDVSLEFRLGSKAVSLPYFSVSGPSKSQRTPAVTVRLLSAL